MTFLSPQPRVPQWPNHKLHLRAREGSILPRFVALQVDPAPVSTEIDPIPDCCQEKDEESKESPRIGWLGYVGVVIGSILGYILFRIIHGGVMPWTRFVVYWLQVPAPDSRISIHCPAKFSTRQIP